MTLGLTLVLVNAISNHQLDKIWQVISDPDAQYNDNEVKKDMLVVAGELLFVAIVSFVAEANDTLGGMLLVLIIGLWIVWSMKNLPTLQGFFDKFQP